MTLKISDHGHTPFQRRMERGHEIRTGHRAEFVHVSTDGTLWHRISVCCGEPIPETVPTWDEAIPEKAGEAS